MTWEEVIRLMHQDAPSSPSGWAVRFTNNPKGDRERGVSFLDWGIPPEPTQEKCEDQYGTTCAYDPDAGGWLPVVGDGLCAFHSNDVEGAVFSAQRWSFSVAYRYIIVGPARLVGGVHDGDVVSFDWGRSLVLPNPDWRDE